MNAHHPPQPQPEPAADQLIGDVARFESVIAGWEEARQTVVIAFCGAIEALHREALRKLIGGLKEAPGALEALRAAAADPVVYAVLRRHGLIRASLQEQVETALASVRPMLASHGGDVELVAVILPDAVEVRFLGNCDGCPASALTFVAGVRRAIEEHCPQIKHVRQVKGSGAAGASALNFTSPFAGAQDRAWSFVVELGAIFEGGVYACRIAGEPVILSRIGRAVSCFQDACSHLGPPISDGETSSGHIKCRHHGFEYALMSGECLTAPEVQLQTHAARVVGERVEVRLRG